MKRASDICRVVDDHEFPALMLSLASAPLLNLSSWRNFEACSRLHELAPCNFHVTSCNSSRLRCWSHQWSSLLVRRVRWVMIIRVKRRPLCKLLWTSITSVIFHCTAYSKASLERSLFCLSLDALFARIGLETTEWWLFEDLWPSRRFGPRSPFSSCGCY